VRKTVKESLIIVIGSMLYAIATVLFIFPHSIVLGGTSGVAVLLNKLFPALSPGTYSVAMNSLLIVLAFFVLVKTMATKTFVGSLFTTFFIGMAEKVFGQDIMLVSNICISSVIGGAVIAFASAIMFYVDSSSGGTDIVALIVRKYFTIDIGKALLITDCIILVAGGVMYGTVIFISSLIGLLIKTLGIDFIITQIKIYIRAKNAKKETV
jgi:uncharacterized membrane-anchored protein YitT (DUF2179 family)